MHYYYSLLICLLFNFINAYALENKLDVNNKSKNVAISLISDLSRIQANGTVTVGIVETIRPGWHVYWINPGDSGEAIKYKWTGLNGLTLSEIAWPIPKKIQVGPLTNYGYDNKVTLLQNITFPSVIPTGEIKLTIDIVILVCQEICIPEQHQVSITFNNLDEQQAKPDLIKQAQLKLPTKVDWPAYYANKNNNLELTIDNPEQLKLIKKLNSIELFFVKPGLVNNAGLPIIKRDKNILMISQEQGELKAENILDSLAILTYKDKKNARKAIELNTKYHVTEQMVNTKSNGISWITSILFAFFGGILLNLMPCVFPILSLKALSLVNLSNKKRAHVLQDGIAYTTGVVLSLLAIAVILMTLKAGGAQIGWGFQLQNPYIIYSLIYLVFILSLLLFGYFELRGSLSNIGNSLVSKDDIVGSFFTGVLAVIVATPCTAPFMGVAIGYALVQSSSFIALTVFVALGFGLALPYLLLCCFPILRDRLPKPGYWMISFKEFLAFPMLLTTIWLLWVLGQQVGNNGAAVALIGLLGVTFGIWLYPATNLAKRKNYLYKLFSFSIVIVSIMLPVYFINTFSKHTVDNQRLGNLAQEFTVNKLASLLKKPNPVFVNMTAAWCITCKVNEIVALNIDSTTDIFIQNKVEYLRGDWTNYDPGITKYLESFNRNGVPLYVFYGKPDAKTGKRPLPIVLPQILTSNTVYNTVVETNK